MLPLRPCLWRGVVVLQVTRRSGHFQSWNKYAFCSCFESNLNGEYFGPGDDNGYYRGIIWELWLGDYSLKSVAMMVRPQDLAQTSLAPLAGLPPDP